MPEDFARSRMVRPLSCHWQRAPINPVRTDDHSLGLCRRIGSRCISGGQLTISIFFAGRFDQSGLAGPRHVQPDVVDGKTSNGTALGGEMAIIRNIDVTAQSEVSFDEACRTVVAEAAKTLRGIMSFRISEAECVVEHDRIIAYRVTGKVVFQVER